MLPYKFTFVVEHDLLTELLCRFVIHASKSSLTTDFIESITVIGKDSQKRCTT